MPVIDRISRAGTGGKLTAIGQNPGTVPVHPILGRALAKAGMESCEGGGAAGDRLSAAQLVRLLDGKTVTDRIRLKQLVEIAGLMPN